MSCKIRCYLEKRIWCYGSSIFHKMIFVFNEKCKQKTVMYMQNNEIYDMPFFFLCISTFSIWFLFWGYQYAPHLTWRVLKCTVFAIGMVTGVWFLSTNYFRKQLICKFYTLSSHMLPFSLNAIKHEMSG